MLRGERVALTTGCMDRVDHLKKSIESWIELEELDSIIIVDWGSREPLTRSLVDLTDERIVIVRTEQSSWQNSRCHNLELQVASRLEHDLVLRVDGDVSVAPDFFQRHPVRDDSFYAVDCHQVPAEVDDKRNLCGTIFLAIRHWRRVNGYNERLTRYGYEDEDLFARLEASGLTWRRCDLDALEHQAHDDQVRFKNLSSAVACRSLLRAVDDSRTKSFLITLSRQLAEASPWTIADQRTEWYLKELDNRTWQAAETVRGVSP